MTRLKNLHTALLSWVRGLTLLPATPAPHRARPARVGEAADRLDTHREGVAPGAALRDGPAQDGQTAVLHLAQEQQRDVQVVHLDPLDGGAGPGQRLLQGDAAVADGL